MWKRKIVTGNLHGSIMGWPFKDLKYQKEKRKGAKKIKVTTGAAPCPEPK